MLETEQNLEQMALGGPPDEDTQAWSLDKHLGVVFGVGDTA